MTVTWERNVTQVTWESATAPGITWTTTVGTGGGGGSSTLAGLTDVAVSGRADGDALVWDSDTSKWVPAAVGGGGAYGNFAQIVHVASNDEVTEVNCDAGDTLFFVHQPTGFDDDKRAAVVLVGGSPGTRVVGLSVPGRYSESVNGAPPRAWSAGWSIEVAQPGYLSLPSTFTGTDFSSSPLDVTLDISGTDHVFRLDANYATPAAMQADIVAKADAIGLDFTTVDYFDAREQLLKNTPVFSTQATGSATWVRCTNVVSASDTWTGWSTDMAARDGSDIGAIAGMNGGSKGTLEFPELLGIHVHEDHAEWEHREIEVIKSDEPSGRWFYANIMQRGSDIQHQGNAGGYFETHSLDADHVGDALRAAETGLDDLQAQIDGFSGGAVDSVNGQTGTVVLGASDVSAQPADSDLTDIAALTPSNDDVLQRKAGAWTNRTPAQLKADMSIGTGDVSGLAEFVNDQVGTVVTAGAGVGVTVDDAANTVTIRSTALALFYGDGTDGDATISGNTTISRDMYYRNLEVTGTLNTAGYRVFVSGTLSGNGTISNAGVAATSNTGASAGHSATIYGSGGAGGNGTTTGGAQPAAVTAKMGGNGGAGGAGTSGSGGAAQTATAMTATAGGTLLVCDPMGFRHGFGVGNGSTTRMSGGAGGSGGGGNGSNAGGGGGSGGGIVYLAARTVTFTGTITAAGGNGANGQASNCGGGGGGGGGLVVVLTASTTQTFTTSVAGGTAGSSGGGSGVAGSNGSAGQARVWLEVA